MLAIVLKILSIVGIALLAVLGLLLLFLLLVLFFPITYRVQGCKDGEGFWLRVRVNWLFGLFRVRFGYPKPGCLTAKALCFSLCNLKIPPEKGGDSREREGQKDAGAAKGALVKKMSFGKKAGKAVQPPKAQEKRLPEGNPLPGSGRNSLSGEESCGKEDRSPKEGEPGASAAEEREARNPEVQTEEAAPEAAPEDNPGFFGKILQKIQKIKYTIRNIYDKIKEIWDNISYYLGLLQEENTKQLAAHALRRMGSILKSIRPKRMAVELIFGMETPDTTGYLYGIYCVLSAALGPGFAVTPDFEQKRLEAKFDIAGHVIIWVFVINGLKLLLDRKLHLFLKKIKAGLKKPEKVPA